MNRKRFVISGLEVLNSIGKNVSEVWGSIMSRNSHIVKKSFRKGSRRYRFHSHVVNNFDFSSAGIDSNIYSSILSWKKNIIDRDFEFLIYIISNLIKEYELSENDLNRTGLIICHENLGLTSFFNKIIDKSFNFLTNKQEPSMDDYFDYIYDRCERIGYDVQTFVPLFQISKLFNIHSYSLFLNNACASGLYAIEAAKNIILGGNVDRMIIASSDTFDLYKYLWFDKLNVYSKNGNIYPFDERAKGLVFGEGAAAILIESLESAFKRKAKIYSEYLGGSFDLEGCMITSPNLLSNSYEKCLSQVLKSSKLKSNEIDIVCPHGVGVKSIDYYESKALKRVLNRYEELDFVSLKPYFGHGLGVSSLMELAILLISAENGIIPETLNYIDTNYRNNLPLTIEHKKKNISVILKSCAAFAGFNAALLFRKFEN